MFSVASYIILYQERFVVFLPVLPVLGIAFILQNMLLRRKYQKPKNNYLRNFKFIQGIITQVSALVDRVNEITEDFVYWRNPNKTMLTLNALLLAAVGSFAFIFLNPLPLRIYIVIGVWAPAAPFSEWVDSLFLAGVDQV